MCMAALFINMSLWIGVFMVMVIMRIEVEDEGIENLIRQRAEAKKAKNFAEADRIRDELKAQGVEVTDMPGGAKWKHI